MQDIQKQIAEEVKNNKIIMYVKGTRQQPMCGFSARACAALANAGAQFATVDVLADEEIREGIKQVSSWPTIPQFFAKGEFIGGSDILAQLFENGELQKIVKG
jgi:monothiol glutaredoxin